MAKELLELLEKYDLDEDGILTDKRTKERFGYFVDDDTNEICLVPEERFLTNIAKIRESMHQSLVSFANESPQ